MYNPADLFPKIYLYKRVVQAKLFIDANYSAPIDLNNISDEAHFSKFLFIRLFKLIYCYTPHQYLTKVRIEKAKLLLAQQISVTEACYAVGFDSVASFTGLFKRKVGITPSTYRQQQLRRQAEAKSNPLKFVPGCFAQTWR